MKAPPLIVADSERSADMLYFSGFHVPDPFVALEIHGKKIGILNALEFGRAKKESKLDVVLPLEEYHEKAKIRWRGIQPGPAEVIALLAEEHKQPSFTIPDDFPAGLAVSLHKLGVDLTLANGAIFPDRELKSRAEIKALKEGNRCSARGIAAAERMLQESVIRKGALFHAGKALTSERLKFAIEVACLEAGAISLNTIAAGGNQACDPHCSGSGPLRANELIIVDVFPRVQQTGYYGDMTRTFLRGKASDAQRSLVEAVRSAQLGALRSVKHGVNGRDIHLGVVAEFEKRGFQTKRSPKGSVGFFHGTGHGVGLAIHEMPRISGAIDCVLRKGAVVTVEPGLYYPGLGACRIEDVVQIAASKPKMLSDYHYEWELR